MTASTGTRERTTHHQPLHPSPPPHPPPYTPPFPLTPFPHGTRRILCCAASATAPYRPILQGNKPCIKVVFAGVSQSLCATAHAQLDLETYQPALELVAARFAGARAGCCSDAAHMLLACHGVRSAPTRPIVPHVRHDQCYWDKQPVPSLGAGPAALNPYTLPHPTNPKIRPPAPHRQWSAE